MSPKKDNKLILFQGRQIRKAFHAGDWWFSIIDVVEALVGGDRPRKYWNDLKKKLAAEGYSEVSEKIGQLKMTAPDGKRRLTDCANTETLFRIIQSIPSPKVEPLKRWLARVGKERIDEIENPELAMGRMQGLYEKKGYPKEWIDKRLRGIAVRQDLTDEWKDRGASTSVEFAILTNEIMQGAFGLKVDEYKQVKALQRDRDSRDMEPLRKDAKDGGAVAGRTRKDIERQTGKPVISTGNFKQLAARPPKKLKGRSE